MFLVLLNPFPGEAAPKFLRRCLDLLSSFRENLEDGLQNYLNKPKYIEDSGKCPVGDEIALIKGVFKDIQIGYDKNDFAALEHRWNGMWSQYTGNLWDIKYSDHPRMYGLHRLVYQPPDTRFFKIFAQKAIHFKDQPAPVVYLTGWESVSFKKVEWAIHVVFVSGYNFWIFGEAEGSKRKRIRPWGSQL